MVTGDVAMGTPPDAALDSVRLLMLANDWSLRHLVPAELAKGFGFLQSKPATAFGPVAVTPDELGDAWRGGRVHLPVDIDWNGQPVSHIDASAEMAARRQHRRQRHAPAACRQHRRQRHGQPARPGRVMADRRHRPRDAARGSAIDSWPAATAGL